MGFFSKLFGLGKKKPTEEQVQSQSPALEHKPISVADVSETSGKKSDNAAIFTSEDKAVEHNAKDNESIADQVEQAEKKEPTCDSLEQSKKLSQEVKTDSAVVGQKEETVVSVVEASKVEETPAPVVEETKVEAAPAPVVEEVKAEEVVSPVVEETKIEAAPAPVVEEVKAEEVVPPVVEETKVEVAPAPVVEEVKAEEVVPPVVEETKVEAAPAPVVEETKAEEVVPPVVEEAKVEATPVAEPVVEEKPKRTRKTVAKKAEETAETATEEKPKRTRKTTAKKAEESAETATEEKPKRTRKTVAKKAEETVEAATEEKPKRTRKTVAKKAESADATTEEKPKRTRKTVAKKVEDAKADSEVAVEKPKRTRKTVAKKTESAQDDSLEGVSKNQESTIQEISSEENRSQEDSHQNQEVSREPEERVEAQVVAPEVVAPVQTAEKSSFFSRLKKTREHLASGFSALIKGRKIDEDLYEELETDLLTADLGIHTTNFIIERLRKESTLRDLHDASALRDNLNKMLCEILEPSKQTLDVVADAEKKPFVILMVGVNGAGKTTTIGKLAQKYKSRGLNVMLAAGDTFRAAAVEQLKEWGTRTGVPVISQPTGSDAASVIFDAVSAAKARNVDVLICDTAGRLQNKAQLMDELEKIVRVMKKIDPAYPNETLLVLDAATGQNAVSQTQIFTDKVNVTGLALTKLDGTARGGIVFSLSEIFRLPIRFIGLGEKAEDLRDFEIKPFVDSVLREEDKE